ncbi:MAG: hypothetical protein QXL78_04650 [Methanocellales archaeon]
MINIHSNELKIPSFIELRHIELLKALDLDGKRVLELSRGLTDEGLEYDAAIIYSAFCLFPNADLIPILSNLKSCIQERLIVVEELAMNRFAKKMLQIKERIFPSYASNLHKLIKQLEQAGFKKVEEKIWKSQIPLSEDEVAWEIRILNRIALERKMDLSKELQELIAIYRTSNLVFKFFAIHSFHI